MPQKKIIRNIYWTNLPKPIIGLAPMDGVTDPAFRAITDEIGHPDIMYTEFVSADGLARNIERLKRTFIRHKSNTPLIAQLFGANEESMYTAVKILCSIGGDGIDLNMGCPNRQVTKHGGGADLILHHDIAIRLIKAAKSAIKDSKKKLPLSVKTRIGFDRVITESWISMLLETDIDAIALHGRLFTQLHSGPVNWEEISKAAKLAKQANKIFLGNGGIESYEDALTKSSNYSPDGVLIGQAAFGNPWVFTDIVPTVDVRIKTAIRHCELFKRLTPQADVLSLRKHLAWYIKSFPNASSLRQQLVQIHTIDEAMSILKSIAI